MQGGKLRKFQRYIVEGMDVHTHIFFNIEADVLDLSLSGASIRSTQRLSMGRPYTFRFTRDEEVTSVQGVVVWEKLVGGRKDAKGQTIQVYTAGVQFLDVFTDKAQQLVEYIRSVAGATAGKRIAGIRLRLQEPGKAVVIRIDEYLVTAIGIGGISIEIDRELAPERVLLFELMIPSVETRLHFTGRVAYCREIPGAEARRFNVGIEIVEMAEREMSRWKGIVETLSPGAGKP